MEQFNLPDFIEKLVIPDLKKMLDQQLHYYAFSVICQAIEIMGAALDSEDLAENGMSEQRFGNSLTHYFKDDRYRQNQKKFFTVLRGPLIHQLRPGEGFFLASETKDKIKPDYHLEKHETGTTILIIEPFLKDFIGAFETFKMKIAKTIPSSPARFTNTFLVVSELSLEYGKTKWDADLKSLVTLTPSVTGSAFLPSK
jgi:hypothetical protein